VATTFDVVVIGAGIVGSAAARECCLAGLRTAIVEAGEPGAATTSAGMGHVVAMDDSPAQLALTKYSRGVWQEQAEMMPAAEFEARGTVWVAADGEEMAEVARRQKTYQLTDIVAEVLDARALAEAEPKLREGLAGGLLVKDDGVCFPPGAAAFYLADARRMGAELFVSRAVTAAQGSVKLADGTVLRAERIVLAVGVECDLLPALPIRRRKGHLLITAPRPGFVHHQVVELGYLKSAHQEEADSIAFNVQPRPNGQIMIGASRQYGNERPQVDEDIVLALRKRAVSYMPELAQVEIVYGRVGFRAATPDKLPLIGPAEGLSEDGSLWLAAGFEGLGITCAPGAARLLVDGMLGRESAIDRGPYAAGRFAQVTT
jgi:glycine/D-amino acid oxidase-like deaminating enzyme